MACDGGFAGFGVEAKVANVFDDFAEVVFVLANELDVFFLLVHEDAGLVLLAGKLAFEIGDAGDLT